jgi:AAA family ATP:ADP antiporter
MVILRPIARLFRRAFDIREGEGLRASLMLLYIFLVISSLMIVKPVCNALFLSKFGVARLPYVFVLVALFAAAGSSIYFRLLKKVQLNRFIIRTFHFLILTLLMFWALLYFDYLEGWPLFLFYIWMAGFAVVSTSQFWLLANLIFNAREAKRLFGFIGAGAIAGGIFGGYLTNFLAPIMGSENLILICGGFLFLCIPITKTVWKDVREGDQDRVEQEQIESMLSNPFRTVRNSRHLTFLASLVGISVVVAKLVEYQFGAIASVNIHNDDELTAFYGFWLSNINIASLVIQLFVTRRIVNILGVGVSIFLLPIGILVGSFSVMLMPSLGAAILLKMIDGSLKQSINKAGIELLALPIAAKIKNQAKAFIDVFVDSFATGVGGLLLIGLTILLEYSVREISIIAIVLLGIWIYLANGVRHEYIKSFREKIVSSDAPNAAPIIDTANESILGGLIEVLQGDNEKEILRVLRMVKEIRSDRLIPCLTRLLHHRSTAIRFEALRNIYYYKEVDFTAEMQELIYDKNLEVKTEAFHYLFQHASDNRIELVQNYLQHGDYSIRGAALLCAARESRNNKKLKKSFRIKEEVTETINQLGDITNPEQLKFIKINCIKVIGAANIPEIYPYLHIFLNDHLPEVLQAAIISAGQTRSRDFLPVLIRCLGNKGLAKYGHEALICYGPEVIIDMLSYYLENPREEKSIRLRIPKVIAAIGAQKSVNILMLNLPHPDLALRFEVIKALNRLRSKFPILKFEESLVVGQILEESKSYIHTLAILNTQGNGDLEGSANTPVANGRSVHEAEQLFVKALESRLDNNLERIFRLLSLKYSPGDIYTAYQGIKNSNPDARVNALEFLDNVLEKKIKKRVIPIIERTLAHSLTDRVLNQFGVKILSEFEGILEVLNGEDNWLKSYALYLIGQAQDTQFVPHICGLINDQDGMVKKFAGYALTKMGILEMTNGHSEDPLM